MTRRLSRIVVVGASLAGLRTAEALRRYGHTGEVVVVGDEPHPPYDRPPLSKQLLSGAWARQQVDLPVAAGLAAQWRLGVPATGLDVAGRRLHMADGRHLDYDGLVLATGARARPWPAAQGLPLGALTLRGLDDCLALATRLTRARHVLVVGAGFLGGEVAGTARALGCTVTLVERQAQPLLSAAGPEVGAFVAELHRHAGIDLRLEVGVQEFAADAYGRLTGTSLTDGQHVPADLAVLALGAVANSDWLTGSGLFVDGGVVCDSWCRALLGDGTPVPYITVAGDLARWPHPLSGGALLSLGHWTNAREQADAAACTLLDRDSAPPFVPMPSFWSDLHAAKIRSIGLPHLADSTTVVEHDLDRLRLVVTYHQHGELVGALTVNRTSRLAIYRQQLQHRLDRLSQDGGVERPGYQLPSRV